MDRLQPQNYHMLMKYGTKTSNIAQVTPTLTSHDSMYLCKEVEHWTSDLSQFGRSAGPYILALVTISVESFALFVW